MNDCISNNSYLKYFIENEIKCILTTSYEERDSIVKLSHASRIIHNFECEIHLIQVLNCKNVLCLVYIIMRQLPISMMIQKSEP